MKKVFCIVLALLLIGLSACGGENAQTAPTVTTPTVTVPTTEADAWMLGGVDIREYTIVYAKEGKFSAGIMESGRMIDVAQALADGIYTLTGVEVPVVSEADTEAPLAHEIIVGMANRTPMHYLKKQEVWEIEQYSYGIQEGTVLVAGGSANACYFGAMEFLRSWENFGMGNYEPAIVKGTQPLIRVACVGDSITEGHGKMPDGMQNDRMMNTYPVFLQRSLGWQYYVCNYGVGGAKMTDYLREEKFNKSLKLQADVVILMLGTNDADPSVDSFSEAYKQEYFYCFDVIYNAYLRSNSQMQMYILTPPEEVPNGMRAACSYMAQNNRELAAEYELQLVDIYHVCEEEQWVFNDTIHPQGEVYQRIAEVIYENIKDTIKK